MGKVIVRSSPAGAFYGVIVKREGTEVSLTGARRLWYWDGAASLSELATEGPAKPLNCKFPAPTEGEHLILDVCEVIPVTDRAAVAIDAVPAWTVR
jgi:hypothetical protein